MYCEETSVKSAEDRDISFLKDIKKARNTQLNIKKLLNRGFSGQVII